MTLIPYFKIMRESKDPRLLRHRMVIETARSGIKPAARLYDTTPRTVRTWAKRFDGTLVSLADRSRAPHHRPRRLSPEAEAQILRARKRLPGWGADWFETLAKAERSHAKKFQKTLDSIAE